MRVIYVRCRFGGRQSCWWQPLAWWSRGNLCILHFSYLFASLRSLCLPKGPKILDGFSTSGGGAAPLATAMQTGRLYAKYAVICSYWLPLKVLPPNAWTFYWASHRNQKCVDQRGFIEQSIVLQYVWGTSSILGPYVKTYSSIYLSPIWLNDGFI